MDEKKPLNKGIKLNASQLPLNNKADFVLGADSRKVLTNKILENLNSTAHHGHFPPPRSGDYKSWSVSREFEIPEGVQEADAQMRMIEGADSSEPLQNDNADPTFSENSNQQEQYDPFFMNDSASADQSAVFFESVASGSDASSFTEPAANSAEPEADDSEPQVFYSEQDASDCEADVSYADASYKGASPEEASPEQSKGSDTESEATTGLSNPAAQEPSPWGAPVFDNQSPAVIRHSQSDTSGNPDAANDSPWGAPPGHEYPIAQSSTESAHRPAAITSSSSEVQSAHTQSDTTSPSGAAETAQARAETESASSGAEFAHTQSVRTSSSPSSSAATSVTQSQPADNLDSKLLPAWMTDLTSEEATTDSGAQMSGQVAAMTDESANEEEFETLLNSIPNEEFIIDNETMRHLFASLIEPKTSYQIVKSAASDAADIAIAAAAAEILHSKVEIDAIAFDDIAIDADNISDEKSVTDEIEDQSDPHVKATVDAGGSNSAHASHDVNATPSAADQDAIQKAYAMLDLTPLPQSQRKEELFDIVAAAAPSAESDSALPDAGAANTVSAIVLRSQRGTIEFATHADGRQLIPSYNACGMLIGVQLNDGVGFALSEEKNIWQMTDVNGRVMQSGITSVSFDKQANLSYTTKRGDIVVLKVDGSIETKFAKAKKQPTEPVQIEEVAAPNQVASDITLELEKPIKSKTDQEPAKRIEPTPVTVDQGSSARKSKSAKPENKAKPESKATKPESKSTKPESKSTKPESKATKPESKSTKPESKSTKPDAKGTKPDTRGAKTDSKDTKPSKSNAAKPKTKPKKSR